MRVCLRNHVHTHLKQKFLVERYSPVSAGLSFKVINGNTEISALFLVHHGLKLRQLFYDFEFEISYGTDWAGHSDDLQAKTIVGTPGKVILIKHDTRCGGVGYRVSEHRGEPSLWGLESHKML